MIRLFIVAASPLSRAGLQDLLVARGLEVIGSSANLDQAGQLPLDADLPGKERVALCSRS